MVVFLVWTISSSDRSHQLFGCYATKDLAYAERDRLQEMCAQWYEHVYVQHVGVIS